MTVPSTNVGLSDIQSEFGGSNPISISEYYAGGSNVPSGTTGGVPPGSIPSSGQISIGQFRGAVSSYDIEYLVIAGGGGGGAGSPNSTGGGGGGAGGYRNAYASEPSGGGGSTLTPYSVSAGQTTINVTVGGGGTGRASQPAGQTSGGSSGSNSSVSGSGLTTYTSTAGGRG